MFIFGYPKTRSLIKCVRLLADRALNGSEESVLVRVPTMHGKKYGNA